MWPRRDPPAQVRPFYLHRSVDTSGVSGTGIVAVGAVLPSGKAVLEWRSRWRTVTIFESVDQIILIHGHGGRTLLHWGEPPVSSSLPAWVSSWQRTRTSSIEERSRMLSVVPALVTEERAVSEASTWARARDAYLTVRARTADAMARQRRG